MENNKIHKLDLFDLSVWYMDISNQFRIRLKDKVDPIRLQEAVIKMQKTYTLLRVHLAKKGGRLVYKESDLTAIVRRIESLDSELSYGDENNNYFPWSIFHTDDTIIIVMHHGLADGTAMFEYVRTLLYYYFAQDNDKELDEYIKKNHLFNLNNLPVSELEIPAKKYSKAEKDYAALPLKKLLKPDVISKEHIKPKNVRPSLVRVIVDTSDLIKVVKESNTSPAAFLALHLFESVRDMYDKEEPIIDALMLVNLRQIFGSYTMHNFMNNHHMQYQSSKLDKMSEEHKYTVIRSILDLYMDRNTAIEEIKGPLKQMELLEYIPFPGLKKHLVKIGSRKLVGTDRKYGISFALSYIGKINLPESFLEKIDDICVDLTQSYDTALIEIFDFKGKMYIHFLNHYKDQAYIERYVNILKEKGISTYIESEQALTDMKYVGFKP